MSTYRQIYDKMIEDGSIRVDEIYRQIGHDVQETDNVQASMHSLIIYLLLKIKELEEKCQE